MKCSAFAVCAVDRRQRERSPECLCLLISQAAAEGRLSDVQALPCPGAKRAAANTTGRCLRRGGIR